MGQQYCDMSNKYRRSTNPQAKDFVKCFNLKTAQRSTNLQFLGAINSTGIQISEHFSGNDITLQRDQNNFRHLSSL